METQHVFSRLGRNNLTMLFAVKYAPSDNQTEADRRRVRRLFVAWEPPPGVALVAHYHLVSGGGFMVVDSESPLALFESLEPFKPAVRFDIEPVVNVIESIATAMDVQAWADSVLSRDDS